MLKYIFRNKSLGSQGSIHLSIYLYSAYSFSIQWTDLIQY